VVESSVMTPLKFADESCCEIIIVKTGQHLAKFRSTAYTVATF